MNFKTKPKTQETAPEFFPEGYIKKAVTILKLVSEESKLRIMLLLAKKGTLTVTEIATT